MIGIIKIELVDMHFWVSILLLQVVISKFLSYISKKNKLNHDRQNKGYKDGTMTSMEKTGVEDNKTYVLNDPNT